MKKHISFASRSAHLHLQFFLYGNLDGVAQNRKSIAREVTTNFLLSAELQTALRNSNTEKCVRVNPFASEFGYDVQNIYIYIRNKK